MGLGRDGGNIIWFFIWLIVLILIGFWLAFFCAFWYIILAPLVVCIPGLKGLVDVLLQGVNFPVFCAESMMGRKSLF